MDTNKIAEKIVKAIGSDEFFMVKRIKLQQEGGVTEISLNNAEKIYKAGYMVEGAKMVYNKKMADYFLMVTFLQPILGEMAHHTFEGFSIGYGGEGPRGLMTFCKMFGIQVSPEQIMNPDIPEKGELILKRTVGSNEK